MNVVTMPPNHISHLPITDITMTSSFVDNSYFAHLNHRPTLSHQENMKYEVVRLQSFAYWMCYDRASPVSLAKAGFVYTGNEDVVKCFICHVTKGGWNRNMNPMEVHKELNCECRFCQGEDGLNIPVYVPEESAYQEILESLHIQYCGTDTPVSNSAELSRRPVDNPDYSTVTFRQNQTTDTQTNFPVMATDAGTAETSRQAIGIQGALVRGHDSEAAPTREEFAPMKQESNRFASFDSSWPRQDTPDPRDLARAGFYYTGTVDRVQCVFCRGILRNWDEDDVPMDEHRRHFPMCPFVMGIKVGNIPDPTAIIAANRTGEFLNVTQPLSVVSDASLGIVTERPKHSQYAVEAARITSFRNWPSGKEQTPQVLAKAGFFYAGFGDSVKCFFCDGGLRTWERGDIPWTEHARWFPRCPYVRQVKGDDFIRSVIQERQTSSAQSTAAANDATVTQVDPRELASMMGSPLVQSALNLGIPKENVLMAVTNRLQNTGDRFPSVEELIDAVYNLSNTIPPQGLAPPSNSLGSLGGSLGDGKSGCCSTSGSEEEDGEESVITADNTETESLLKENEELKEQRRCKICMDSEVNVVFLPCGHLVCCASCAPALRKCPICRCVIRGTVRTFMS